jgi:hypothetical protein
VNEHPTEEVKREGGGELTIEGKISGDDGP